MVCQCCKKNDATNIYKRTDPISGKVSEEKYCMECYYRISEERKREICSNCGTTVKEFKEKRLVGCAVCYESFRDEIMRSVVKMQGADRHVSSEPPVNDKMKQKKREHEQRIVLGMRGRKGDGAWQKA